jgi:arylsulfatase
VPGIISWPAVVKGNRVSWDTVATVDFLPTVMEVLNVKRPESQQSWGFDGQSVMPLLTGKGAFPLRGMGWMYQNPSQAGFRYGRWKLVNGTKSCSSPDCRKPLLFDLEADLAEAHDLAEEKPDILQAITANYTVWFDSVMRSRNEEQHCPPFPKELAADIF